MTAAALGLVPGVGVVEGKSAGAVEVGELRPRQFLFYVIHARGGAHVALDPLIGAIATDGHVEVPFQAGLSVYVFKKVQARPRGVGQKCVVLLRGQLQYLARQQVGVRLVDVAQEANPRLVAQVGEGLGILCLVRHRTHARQRPGPGHEQIPLDQVGQLEIRSDGDDLVDFLQGIVETAGTDILQGLADEGIGRGQVVRGVGGRQHDGACILHCPRRGRSQQRSHQRQAGPVQQALEQAFHRSSMIFQDPSRFTRFRVLRSVLL